MAANGGRNFLDDKLLVRKVTNEEKDQQRAQQLRKQLETYQESLDLALAEYLSVNGRLPDHNEQGWSDPTIQAYQTILDRETKKLTLPSSSSSSSSLIQDALNSEVKKADFNPRPRTRAKAVRIFNSTEMEQILTRYNSLPDALKKLMDAAIGDDLDFGAAELVRCPVFIRREGKIYDQEFAEGFLRDNEEALCPTNDTIKYKKEDIIPCNSLLKAMDKLLDVIKTGIVVVPGREEKLDCLSKIEERSRISREALVLIEQYYELELEPKHKMLFDAICRDPITHEIMDKPVFLPDGWVYDESTALTYLNLADGVCPLSLDNPDNPMILFTKEDITPCHFVIAVLDCLNLQIQEKIKAAVEAAKQRALEKKDDKAPGLSKGANDGNDQGS